MPQKRGTATDNLLNIIQVIQLGQKTGCLLVERGEKTALEEGEIVFVSGQIVEDYTNDLIGQRALDWLKTWKLCRFLFVRTSLSSRPMRTQNTETAIQVMNQSQLSRLHLHLFLLIDGQRDVVELARLVSKKPEEVQKLLMDLETIGIIRQVGA